MFGNLTLRHSRGMGVENKVEVHLMAHRFCVSLLACDFKRDFPLMFESCFLLECLVKLESHFSKIN